MHPRPTSIVALIVVLAAAACTATPRPRAAAPAQTQAATAAATPTPTHTAPTPVKKAAPAPILVDERTIAVSGFIDRIVPAGPVVYTLGGRQSAITVSRIDVAAATVTAHRTFSGDIDHASVGGGRLAVLLTTSANPNRPPQPATLVVLDLRTLATVASRRLTPLAGDVLARPEATYVSVPGHILALDPKTLRTLRSIRVEDSRYSDEPGAEIAADPRSHILYAGIPNGPGPEPHVDIVDLRTGRLLAKPGVGAVVVAEPQGYGDDGWVYYATGMMASAELLSPAGKVLGGMYLGPNSSTLAVTGRHVWAFASVDGTVISCNDLRTGKVQGAAPKMNRLGARTAADNTHVYLGGDHELIVFTPSGACA